MKRNVQNTKFQTPSTSKGITLVALVITIIILLILAGVAINMAINSGGLFGKANEAVEKYNQARKNESDALSSLQDILTEIETGVKVEQVTDTKPGELEQGEDANTYIINSIEDLVFFSHDVRQGNTYAEKTVKLGTNLDFNSSKSYVDPYRKDYGKYGYNGELKTLLTSGEGFIPIGDYHNAQTNNFKGLFNGNNKIICNLYINIGDDNEYIRTGLFGRLEGKIIELGLENVNITARCLVDGTQVGTICAQMTSDGLIDSCYVTGQVNSTATNSGGITGYCAGIIKNCCSEVNINSNVMSETDAGESILIGGIAQQITSTSTIANCYYAGDINITTSGFRLIIGGFVGRNRGNIKNCYNIGNIIINSTISETLSSVGGIVGEMASTTGVLDNCYVTGEIDTSSSTGEAINEGGVIGYRSTKNSVTDCYYLSTNATKGTGTGTDDTIAVEKESDMEPILTVLNIVESGEGAFKASDRYPILSWQ